MKSFIVAEIASNWEGNFTKAEKLMQKSKNAGANAVKFQIWRAHDLYNNTHPNWKFIKKSEITLEKAIKLKKIADKIGIEFFCSAFYPEAIDILEKLKVKRYKIASRTCLLKDPHSLETLKKIALTKKPVIISMGMGGNMSLIRNIFSKNKTLFCYCISEYPTDFKKINWKKALSFNGFSDHTLDINAAIIFVALKHQAKTKSCFIEKHVKLKNSKGPDADTSIDTNQLSDLVNYVRILQNNFTKI